MRNSTLLAALMVLASSTTMAQTQPKNRIFKQLKNQTEQEAKQKAGSHRSPLKSSATALTLPLHEDTYVYEDGEWFDDATYDMTYNKQGKTLSLLTTYEGEESLTQYTYNEDGNVTEEINSNGDGSGEYVKSSRLTKAYDSKVSNFVVESMEYLWDEDWTLTNAGRTWKRNVNRNENGNVTGVSVMTYYDGDFEESQRTSLTYNEEGQADTWKSEELTYDYSTGDFAWKGLYTMTNIEWENTDGQIVADEMEEFFTGNNRVSTATVVDEEEGIEGQLGVEYEDDGGYTYGLSVEEPLAYGQCTLSYTDANGSYTIVTWSRSDDNGDGRLDSQDARTKDVVTVKMDEHGNMVSEEETEDGELVYGVKYEYKYDEDSDYPTEQIHYEYDFDEADYVPFMKVVSSDFVDVTTGVKAISEAKSDTTTSIYNMQGVMMGTSSNQLPAGLYIKKMGEKTVKVVRK